MNEYLKLCTLNPQILRIVFDFLTLSLRSKPDIKFQHTFKIKLHHRILITFIFGLKNILNE